MKDFILAFIRNLALLAVVAVVFLIIFPDMTKQIFGVYGALGVPFVLAFVVMAALPRKRRMRR